MADRPFVGGGKGKYDENYDAVFKPQLCRGCLLSGEDEEGPNYCEACPLWDKLLETEKPS